MSLFSISKPSAGAVKSPLNHQRRGGGYKATLMNKTSATITIQITNENIETVAAPTFADPASGVLMIAVDTVGVISDPYDGVEITGAGTGTIHVVEVG